MYIGLDFVAGGKAPRIFLPNCGCGGGQTQSHGAPETLQIGIEFQFHCTAVKWNYNFPNQMHQCSGASVWTCFRPTTKQACIPEATKLRQRATSTENLTRKSTIIVQKSLVCRHYSATGSDAYLGSLKERRVARTKQMAGHIALEGVAKWL